MPTDTDIQQQSVFFGLVAKIILDHVLDNSDGVRAYIEPHVAGYFQDGTIGRTWIAFDNRGGNCWVEEFYTQEQAIDWINGKDIED
jgi:myo-inositol-hexaphosphate 3-phosphohydrolase